MSLVKLCLLLVVIQNIVSLQHLCCPCMLLPEQDSPLAAEQTSPPVSLTVALRFAGNLFICPPRLLLSSYWVSIG